MKRPNDVKRPNTNSGSLGQFLRSRSRPIDAWFYTRGVYSIGRNEAKREHRASKTSRKHWRKVA